ncbi:MAG: ribosome biogenesis GTPase Der [Chloroflexi bacterium]|nr:ribosome biogenesis GTPase Der [Chloroflexota bacterium]MDA1002327.1 ribosome biogenesis GTPase Der [Chloroflexota bacterium]MQC27499.1 ribosome biogenesis GTPase Der [Chloroflexota bacterium]
MNVDTAPLVAIVGRPNVGKSALFNRLTRSNRALVEDIAGTTRDRNYAHFEWRGRFVRVVDTGGLFGPDEEDPFGPLLRAGVERVLREADAVLFLVDGAVGPTSADQDIAEMLRRSGLPVILVATKSDVARSVDTLPEMYALGFGEPFAVSALHGRAVGDLMDRVLEIVGGADSRERFAGIRIAIIGRPNVGKSSIVNAILGDERTIVSDIPGTTRDAIDTPFTFEGHELQLVDTAGIRRRGKVERGVERHSVQRAQAAIDRSDVVFLVIDREEAITAQDTHIAGYAVDQAKGLVLVVNKWDLSEPGTDRHLFAKQLDARYRFAPWAPILMTSAVRGQGIVDLLQAAVHIAEVRRRRVQTADLNRIIHRATSKHSPPTTGTRRLKVLYATQADISPPTIVIFVNDPELAHFSYRRYLENQIREAFDFEGTALRIHFRRRSDERVEATA